LNSFPTIRNSVPVKSKSSGSSSGPAAVECWRANAAKANTMAAAAMVLNIC
jgi:hypothetical protein